MRFRAALCAVLVLAGCGGGGTLAKQAAKVSSIAAEGSLLAHDAAEGDTTATFTRVHARELRKKLVAVQVRQRRLRQVATSVARDLAALSDGPADRPAARLLERRLEAASKTAGEIERRA